MYEKLSVNAIKSFNDEYNFLDFERNMVDGLYAVASAIGKVAEATNKRNELEESKEDIFK